MTDLITRARKKWCEVHKSPEDAPDGEAWHYTLPCPQDVVAALLDVLREASYASYGPSGDTYCAVCGSARLERSSYHAPVIAHMSDCALIRAKAAIEKALEEK